MKNFFDSDLWKWITCLIEIALLVGAIILAVKALEAFIMEVST